MQWAVVATVKYIVICVTRKHREGVEGDGGREREGEVEREGGREREIGKKGGR